MPHSSTLPVVLVHGAWHGAWCWAAVQAELDRMGVPSYAIDLPGHGASSLPFGDLHACADRVATFIERLDTDVVLVGHSFGGAVITEAGLHTAHVRHLVYLTAFVLDEGESMVQLPVLPDAPPSLLTAARYRPDAAHLALHPDLAVPALYGHCTPEVQRAAVARLGLHPVASFVQPVTGAAWRRTPSTYVRCTDDQAIRLVHQDAMAARCTNVETLHTDHSPFASMPVETARILAARAGRNSVEQLDER
jgi:pimeloyl-ACP methyl ester carboxylesterase